MLFTEIYIYSLQKSKREANMAPNTQTVDQEQLFSD